MILPHVSCIATWSWIYNAKALRQEQRTYTNNLIGEAECSELGTLEHVTDSSDEQIEQYV